MTPPPHQSGTSAELSREARRALQLRIRQLTPAVEEFQRLQSVQSVIATLKQRSDLSPGWAQLVSGLL